MAKLSSIYTLYLKPAHLPTDGSRREVTIEKATVETIHPRPGQEAQAVVIAFKGKPHKMILNQGNANRMYEIAGDDLESWPGLVIGLKRSKWGAKETIIIEAVTNDGKDSKKRGEIPVGTSDKPKQEPKPAEPTNGNGGEHWSQVKANRDKISQTLNQKGILLEALFKANDAKNWDGLKAVPTGKQAIDKTVAWWEINKPDQPEKLSPELEAALNGAADF